MSLPAPPVAPPVPGRAVRRAGGIRAAVRRAWWRPPLALALGAAAVAAYGVTPALVLPAYLAVVSGALCAHDFVEHRLPNALIGPGYAIAAVQLTWLGLAGQRMPWPAIAAGAGSFAFFLLMAAAGGMGMGDVKLAGLIGVCLGSLSVAAAVAGPVLGFLAGGIAGLCALLSPAMREAGRIPLGPYLLFGLWSAPAVVGAVTG